MMIAPEFLTRSTTVESRVAGAPTSTFEPPSV
jgi:hypothetical protein